MNIHPVEQIESISNFRTKTDQVLKGLAEQKTILLTQHGKTCAVLVEPNDYEAKLERLRLAEKILQGEKEIEEGKGLSHTEVVKVSKSWLK